MLAFFLTAASFVTCRHQQAWVGTISLQVAAFEPRRLADASAGLRQDLNQDAEGAIVFVCDLHDAQHVSIGQHHTAGVLAARQAFKPRPKGIAVGDAIIERCRQFQRGTQPGSGSVDGRGRDPFADEIVTPMA